MSYPGPVTPEMFGTQNKSDDDGQVIDSFFIETDSPPNLKEATQPIPAPVATTIPVATKILTKSQSIDPTWGTPTQLLPADVRRKCMGFRVNSPGSVATDGVRIASDIGDLLTAGRVLHGQTLSDALSCHTGAIYAVTTGLGANGAASAVVNVEIWAVTE
jgi:hypothetical protein